jgi:hypothetical protein
MPAEIVADAASLDWKVLGGFALTGSGTVVSLIFNYLNWRRTGEVNARTHANNRAARFEAVHGSSISAIATQLRDIPHQISLSRSSFTSLTAAKKFAKDSLKIKLVTAENAMVNEAGLLSRSRLTVAGDHWKAATDPILWEDIWEAYAKLLGASSIDNVPPALDRISERVSEILQLVQTARENENVLDNPAV